MESRFRLLGHPAHPMLVMFPVALLPLLLVLDVLYWWLGNEALFVAGFWVAAFGLVTTLVAIVPGVIDMAAIPDGTRAHRTALYHAIVGTTVAIAYAAATWVRWTNDASAFGLAFGIDLVGTLLVAVQGWLGGELVYRHHVGVKTIPEGGDPVVLEGASAEAARATRERQRRPGV